MHWLWHNHRALVVFAGLILFAVFFAEATKREFPALTAIVGPGIVTAFGYCAFWALRRIQNREYDRERSRGIESESVYSILGVKQDATGEEIRRAYRALAGRYHPDNYPEDQKAKMTASLLRINQAYEMVNDEDVRFEYDSLVLQHEPSAPPFDAAYEYILEWRSRVSYADEYGFEGELDDLSETEPSVESSASDEMPAGPVPIQIPQTFDDGSGQESQRGEPVPTMQNSVHASGECPACGEPYVNQQHRTGPILCERCGEELSRRGN